VPEGKATGAAPLWLRGLKAFGAFWWDFLVSDTPELLIGVLAVIGIVALISKGASLNAVAVFAFPVLVVAVLAGSLAWARRAKR
jgi:hypothetical protein